MAGNGTHALNIGRHFDLRLAQHFVVLVEEGSFSKAAKRLFLSQSALTKQVQVLERTFANNTHFIDRSRRPWQLTPAGHEFLAMCHDVLSRTARGARRLTAGPVVKIGLTGDSNGWPIARLTEAIQGLTQHCGVEFVLLHRTVGMQTLQRGEVDVLLTQPADSVAAVCWRPGIARPGIDTIVQAIEHVVM